MILVLRTHFMGVKVKGFAGLFKGVLVFYNFSPQP